MDKIYPRLKIIRKVCHCGAVACKTVDGLPWQVFHVQFEGQLNPLQLFTSAYFEAAREYAARKVDGVKKKSPEKYYLKATPSALLVEIV